MNTLGSFPNKILSQLYTRGTLYRKEEGLSFSLKNRLTDFNIEEVLSVSINSRKVGNNNVTFIVADRNIQASELNGSNPLFISLKQEVHVFCKHDPEDQIRLIIEVGLKTDVFGVIKLKFEDKILQNGQAKTHEARRKITRKSGSEDFSSEVIAKRLNYVSGFIGSELFHIRDYSANPKVYRNRCENFIGAAHVPIGIAGPIKVNGKHAKGEYLVPLATTEGTLVASYNRGIKLVNLCGGVNTIVTEDSMQRAPVFVFKNASTAYNFARWIESSHGSIKEQCESSSRYAKLIKVEIHLSNKFVFLRFNYTTGDAAGQNMVNKATLTACNWIIGQSKIEIEHFFLESNMATDKKPSFINSLNTRGKKVTADLIIRKEILEDVMRVDPGDLNYHESVANIGSFLSRTNNNGLHSANALAAIFIATGQDVASVAESSSCITYSELLPGGDLYFSITLPSLVVATHGGGTNLPTQRECLEIMQCDHEGAVYKLAEIVAATVIAGELSLACAISSLDWVVSHEEMGR